MMPFTEGDVTIEGWCQLNYDTPVSTPLFPGPAGLHSYNIVGFIGACDIGFVATPQ